MSTVANPYASPQTTDLAQEGDSAPVEPKIFAYAGRLGRMRLAAYTFFSSLLFLPLAALALTSMLAGSPAIGGLIYFAMIVLSAIYGFSLYVRRLHDLNQSGLWSLLIFVPIANIGLLIFLFFFRGTDGANQYGAQTTPNSTAVKVGFVLTLIFAVLMPILAAISIPAYQDYLQRVQQVQMQ